MADNQHILVVDDDREIRRLLCEYLEKNGYRTTAVAEGKGMRRAMEHTHIDLIVLDPQSEFFRYLKKSHGGR